MTKFMKYCILAGVACSPMLGFVPAKAEQVSATSAPASTKLVQTEAYLRDLWVGHGFWVRNVVVETLGGNAAAAAVAEKEAVANAKLIAAALEPYYGKDASNKMFALLGGHYGAIKQYLDATKSGNSAKQDTAGKALVANGQEIAMFLSSANPSLPYEVLLSSLMAHGGHHVQQIQQLKAKHYDQEAQTWEAMKVHMYGIAQVLTTGLAKQFPAKFI